MQAAEAAAPMRPAPAAFVTAKTAHAVFYRKSVNFTTEFVKMVVESQ